MNDQYYILKDDDIIQRGDEWTTNERREWVICSSSIGWVNAHYGVSYPGWQVRRKIKTTPLGNIYDNR